MKKKFWVYDIEVFENFFCIVLEELENDDQVTFMIHPNYRNEYDEMVGFLRQEGKVGSIFFGFNNLSYDSQVIEHMIQHHSEFSMLKPIEICREAWMFSNSLIHGQDTPGYRIPYPDFSQTL